MEISRHFNGINVGTFELLLWECGSKSSIVCFLLLLCRQEERQESDGLWGERTVHTHTFYRQIDECRSTKKPWAMNNGQEGQGARLLASERHCENSGWSLAWQLQCWNAVDYFAIDAVLTDPMAIPNLLQSPTSMRPSTG